MPRRRLITCTYCDGLGEVYAEKQHRRDYGPDFDLCPLCNGSGECNEEDAHKYDGWSHHDFRAAAAADKEDHDYDMMREREYDEDF
jgi:DnaJ-class molecular chaperone